MNIYSIANRAALIVAVTIFGNCAHPVFGETSSPTQNKFHEFRGSYQLIPNADSVTIPFELFGRNIRMKARINGQECNVLLDNGSLWDALLFFGSPKVDALKLNITGTTTLGGSMNADTSSKISIDFDGLAITDQEAVIMPYVSGAPNPWERADVQVSSAFFKNFVVEINFDKRIIRLTKPEAYTYEGDGEIVKMSPGIFDSRTSRITVETHDAKMIDLDLLLDLGGLYELYLPIGNGITVPPDAKLESLGVGGFGASEGYVGTVKEVRIGKYRLENIEAAFIEVQEGQNDYGSSMIGFPLFQRFNVTFDYFGERMILEPSMMY